ncbi:PREDICTED: protein indeterminate-domain 12-like isoform X2 [Lupinus angustifolius]|uniref:protein indeterminate-domain 12-like isoform X2 n=1 Tax=Lupinus angustifolius TaxID=3871 RepID=UPI00092EF9FC|nr:PREDICTED: protein indeterminate-domain 12-like isoform X2 [Lupinus angustifolius]
MSNITSCDSGSFSTENTREDAVKQQLEILGQFNSPHSHTTTNNNSNVSNTSLQQPPSAKRKRSLPGNPDPKAEVIALSPNALMATNRFLCEICNKGFQRDQNLQLHRRGHNLPWKLKQRTSTEIIKRVYVCPEPSCVHHNPARALGDLTGIKKHFCRKHGEKKWKCDKCSKKYAVQSDWKAHSKICGTREYKCDCGTLFSRRDSFITHRAFCEEQLSKMGSNLQCQPMPNLVPSLPINTNIIPNPQVGGTTSEFNNHSDQRHNPLSSLPNPATSKPFNNNMEMRNTCPSLHLSSNLLASHEGSSLMSATVLLQKAAQMGATLSNNNSNIATTMAPLSFGSMVQLQQQQQPDSVHSFMNHYMQQQQQDHVSSQYNNFNANHDMSTGDNEGSVAGMNGVDMFNVIYDQSKALSKIIEQNNRSINSGVLHQKNGGSSSGATSIGGSKGSGDVMTLDLLGTGGGGDRNLNIYDGAQHAETSAEDEVWRNWSNKNEDFESFSASSSM